MCYTGSRRRHPVHLVHPSLQTAGMSAAHSHHPYCHLAVQMPVLEAVASLVPRLCRATGTVIRHVSEWAACRCGGAPWMRGPSHRWPSALGGGPPIGSGPPRFDGDPIIGGPPRFGGDPHRRTPPEGGPPRWVGHRYSSGRSYSSVGLELAWPVPSARWPKFWPPGPPVDGGPPVFPPGRLPGPQTLAQAPPSELVGPVELTVFPGGAWTSWARWGTVVPRRSAWTSWARWGTVVPRRPAWTSWARRSPWFPGGPPDLVGPAGP